MKCIGVQIPSAVLQRDLRAETYVKAMNFADKMGFRLERPEDFEEAQDMFALLRQETYHAERVAVLQEKLNEQKKCLELAKGALNARVERLIEAQKNRT